MIQRIRSKIFRLKRYIRNKIKTSSSSSDDGTYPIFCLKASKDEMIFKNFKRNFIYNQVLEHVSESDGWKYKKEIEKLFIEKGLGKYKSKLYLLASLNDSIGNPRRYSFDERLISPTSLRYMKVTLDILNLLNGEKINNIVEIGGGYGGQALMLSLLFVQKGSFTIFDLPEVNKLINKFTKLTFIDSLVNTKNFVDEEINYDLFISNYALSELSRKNADLYLKKVLSRSKHGYITFNNIGDNDSVSKEEICKFIPKEFVVVEENPIMSQGGVIIKW